MVLRTNTLLHNLRNNGAGSDWFLALGLLYELSETLNKLKAVIDF
jgi:hypothetical protein